MVKFVHPTIKFGFSVTGISGLPTTPFDKVPDPVIKQSTINNHPRRITRSIYLEESGQWDVELVKYPKYVAVILTRVVRDKWRVCRPVKYFLSYYEALYLERFVAAKPAGHVEYVGRRAVFRAEVLDSEKYGISITRHPFVRSGTSMTCFYRSSIAVFPSSVNIFSGMKKFLSNKH